MGVSIAVNAYHGDIKLSTSGEMYMVQDYIIQTCGKALEDGNKCVVTFSGKD